MEPFYYYENYFNDIHKQNMNEQQDGMLLGMWSRWCLTAERREDVLVCEGLTLALAAGVEGSDVLLFGVEETWGDNQTLGQYNLQPTTCHTKTRWRTWV